LQVVAVSLGDGYVQKVTTTHGLVPLHTRSDAPRLGSMPMRYEGRLSIGPDAPEDRSQDSP
jgi:hypothetical protein